MRETVEKLMRRLAKRAGYDLRRHTPAALPADLEPSFVARYELSKVFTKTSPERMYALYQAVKYVVRSPVPGAIVECGVWRGGSSMLAALALLEEGVSDRELWLYDTYEGMAEPGEHDRDFRGVAAKELLEGADRQDEQSVWCYSSLDAVQRNMASTGYPASRIRYVQGKVEDRIPAEMPGEIALLRLDTDFYESTYHELRHLFPRIAPGGILIIDDYGHWEGARRATDQFFREIDQTVLLHRIDYTGRIAVVQRAGRGP